VISTSEHELARRAVAPEATPASSRRLSILTQREIDDLYGLPRFTEEDGDVLKPVENWSGGIPRPIR